MEEPLGRTVGRFVAGLVLDDVPQTTQEKLRSCILNGLGAALSGTANPQARHALQAVLSIDDERATGATLLADGRKTTAAGAAVANCVLFNGVGGQYDTLGSTHVGMVVIPLALAMAEAGCPSRHMLTAILAGYEVAGLFDLAYGTDSSNRGFRPTAVYGLLAAAATAGKMLALDETRMASALSIAVSFAGGLLQHLNDGTGESSHQAGAAIRNGLAAAYLAKAGMEGAAHAFEGSAGLVSAIAGRRCDAAALLAPLGRDWAIERVYFQRYPICALNQTPVIAASRLRPELNVDDVRAVTVRMNPDATNYAGIDSRGPFTTQTSHAMSTPFCVALTLLRGEPLTVKPLNIFDDEPVNALAQKIEMVSDPSLSILSTAMEFAMKDGSTRAIDLNMTSADYAFPRSEIATMVRGADDEARAPARSFDMVEAFVDGLPDSAPRTVVEAFRFAQAGAPSGA